MPATPKIVSTPFSFSASTTRWKPSVISTGICASLISPTVLIVAQGLMHTRRYPSTADPLCSLAEDNNQELCANAALLNQQQISGIM